MFRHSDHTMPIELTSHFNIIDPRFQKVALPNVHAEKLYTGCRWAEGPAWFAAGRYLVWSDIPKARFRCSANLP